MKKLLAFVLAICIGFATAGIAISVSICGGIYRVSLPDDKFVVFEFETDGCLADLKYLYRTSQENNAILSANDPCQMLATMTQEQVREIAQSTFRKVFGPNATIEKAHDEWAEFGSESVENEISRNPKNEELRRVLERARCRYVQSFEVTNTNTTSGKDTSVFVAIIADNENGMPTIRYMVAKLT